MRGQLWRTVRTLGVAFLLMSGLGALFEEKGLSRGMLANPDMQPQLETKTKFADVKGVDEAKARSLAGPPVTARLLLQAADGPACSISVVAEAANERQAFVKVHRAALARRLVWTIPLVPLMLSSPALIDWLEPLSADGYVEIACGPADLTLQPLVG